MTPTWREELDDLNGDGTERRDNGPPGRSNRPVAGRAKTLAAGSNEQCGKTWHAPTPQKTHRLVRAITAIVLVATQFQQD